MIVEADFGSGGLMRGSRGGRPSLAVLEAILKKKRNQLHQFHKKNLFFLQNFLKIEKTSFRFSSSLKTSIEERRVSILGSLYCKIFVQAKKKKNK